MSAETTESTEKKPEDAGFEERKREQRKGLIERVRKYLALTESDNPHEARIAKKRADEIVAVYGITAQEIRGETVTDVGEHAIEGDFSAAWRIALLTIIAQSFHAKAVRLKEIIVKDGRPTDFWHGRVICLNKDVNEITYLFTYYETAVNEVVKLHGYDKVESEEEESFRRGLVYTLQQRFVPPPERQAQQAAESKEMSKTSDVKKETNASVEKKYPNRSKASDLGRVKDRHAFYQGIDVARQIPLAGIHRNKPRTKLESAETPTNQEDP